MHIEHVDGIRIPTVRERGTRRAPQPPDPRQAATAMLKAMRPGNEPLIEGSLAELSAVLAAIELGAPLPMNRMTPAQRTEFRRAEREWRAALPKLTRTQMRELCIELGGTEPTPR